MPLTDIAIKNAKPADKPLRLYDEGRMYLEISPTGGKIWRMKYRFGGKEKTLALGKYPCLGKIPHRDSQGRTRRP
jgi:hypothetical protein